MQLKKLSKLQNNIFFFLVANFVAWLFNEIHDLKFNELLHYKSSGSIEFSALVVIFFTYAGHSSIWIGRAWRKDVIYDRWSFYR